MRRNKPKKEFRMTRFSVRGRGRFPYDMLRYDSCVPDTGEDSNLIDDRDLIRGQERLITLRRFNPEGAPASVDRWHSFHWYVIADEAKGELV